MIATTKSGATAIHDQDGTDHVVGIGNLRVIICQEGDLWFAQGLEIDYASEGTTFQEVKKNFETGLKGTVELHLKAYGSLDNLLKLAPASAWNELLKDGKRMRYSTVSLYKIEEPVEQFPFAAIDYYMERQAA